MALQTVTALYSLQMYFKSANQGWSERHWLPATGTGTLLDRAKQLVDYRLALLPPSCSLVYAKYSEVARERDSIPMAYAYPTAGTWPGDPFVTPETAPTPGSVKIEVSQIAVLIRMWTAQGFAASRWVHGVPDNRVTAEVLANAIVMATEVPPAIGAGTFSTDWAVRFGYYMFLIRANTVYARHAVGLAGLRVWQTDVIENMIVRGVSVKKTGRPFGQRAGRVAIGA